MSIKIGNTGIERLYIGSTRINKSYVGTTQVFGEVVVAPTNLILNGTFEDTTNISLDNGWSWDSPSESLYFTDGFDNADAVFTTSEDIVAGDYEITFDIISAIQTNNARIAIQVNGTNVVALLFYGRDTTQTLPFTYSGAASSVIEIRGSNSAGGGDFYIDNVSLVVV